MNGLKELLKKKDNITKSAQPSKSADLVVPEFRMIRTTTETEEIIEPPHFDGDDVKPPNKDPKKERRRTLFSRSASAGIPKDVPKPPYPLVSDDIKGTPSLPVRPKAERKLSERLHISGRSRSKTNETTSSHLPENLPAAPDAVSVPSIGIHGTDEVNKYANAQREAQWEKRATILASSSSLQLDRTDERVARPREPTSVAECNRDRSRNISDQQGDVNIQEAIRLHEEGDLTSSTYMFGALADPKGANNALSQVLYGLALRHGWGIPPEPDKAIHYLSLAASNSAAVEQAALAAGMTKGGAAKGELVLAIFELANCFRYAWGVKKDPVAARQYYETAANLGDTDALEEAAWCFLEGFGGPKDKVSLSIFIFLRTSLAPNRLLLLEMYEFYMSLLSIAGPMTSFPTPTPTKLGRHASQPRTCHRQQTSPTTPNQPTNRNPRTIFKLTRLEIYSSKQHNTCASRSRKAQKQWGIHGESFPIVLMNLEMRGDVT
jgi:hypothetical protein